MKRLAIFAAMAIVMPVLAQTKLSLKGQAVEPDLSKLAHTRPVQVGTILPATCLTGELFFNSNSPSGQNLFGCSSTNIWALLSGSSGGSDGGSGAGNISCIPASGSGSIYACAGSPAPTSLQQLATMTVILVPNVANTIPDPALNIAGLGAKPILHRDGSGLATGELTTGKSFILMYDGASFQMLSESLAGGASGAITVNRSVNPPMVDIVTSVVPTKVAPNVWSGSNDFSSAAFLRVPNGPGLPVATDCAVSTSVGRIFQRSDTASANASFFVCSQIGPGSYAWELVQQTSAGGGSGGAGTPPSTAGVLFFGDFATGTGVRPSDANGSGKGGQSRLITVPIDIAYDSVIFNLASAASASGGLFFAILAPGSGSVLCLTETGYAGASGSKNTSTTGVKRLKFQSGSAVVNNVCTLSHGTYLSLVSAEEYGMQLSGNYQSDTAMAILGQLSPTYAGLTSTPVATGSGASYAFSPSGYAGATFTTTPFYSIAFAIGR